ncbi:MAG: acyl-CoA synthetase family protein [Methylomicrobium sp.]
MSAEPISLTHCALPEGSNRIVAVHAGQAIDRQRFSADVAGLAQSLTQQNDVRYALYDEEAYSFAVALYAALHAGKQVWIASNNKPGTADQLIAAGCVLIGSWHGKERAIPRSIAPGYTLTALDASLARLVVYTSGSTGEPKAIDKSLMQLQREVVVLERLWGGTLGAAASVATVSHQHIYGLLFRLLWPLAAGRRFYSQLFLSPEPLLKAVADQPAYWVASPAQLKRLDERSEWAKLARLAAIFSSGGPLTDEAADRIEQRCGQRVIEIYGSSETGGIGWRCGRQDQGWLPFPGIRLVGGEDGICRLDSPYLGENGWHRLDDRIELFADGRFGLSGRLDRIVKVEEKRLSLDELERSLCALAWVEQAYAQLLTNRRDRIAVAIVPSAEGSAILRQQGRAFLIKRMRRELERVFESVVVPRRWLFVDRLPQTAQGKIDSPLLGRLFTQDSAKLPQLLSCYFGSGEVRLELRVQRELVYFEGHFPGTPILPGVAQLAWAEHYGHWFFPINHPFLTMEAVKFKKIIQPDALVTLTLSWQAASGKLRFDLSSAAESHSSGRIVYGERR